MSISSRSWRRVSCNGPGSGSARARVSRMLVMYSALNAWKASPSEMALLREPPSDRLIGDRLEQSCPDPIQEAVGYGVSRYVLVSARLPTSAGIEPGVA